MTNRNKRMTETSQKRPRIASNHLPTAKALIIINAEVLGGGKKLQMSPVTEKMMVALKQAIEKNSRQNLTIEVLAAGALWSRSNHHNGEDHHIIYCPLTIQLPDFFVFPGSAIYQACKDIEARRKWVGEHLGYKTSLGNSHLGDMWLPIAFTSKEKEIVYGEVIGEGAIPNSYQQPIPLSDRISKSLHHLAEKLLLSISPIPSVYLLQFRLLGQQIVFDRLWPFPAAPALASLHSEKSNLFVHYWSCLNND